MTEPMFGLQDIWVKAARPDHLEDRQATNHHSGSKALPITSLGLMDDKVQCRVADIYHQQL